MADKPKHVYDESKIKTLSSLEHIRLRTGMYIGRIGDGSHYDDGCYILLKEVIDNAKRLYRYRHIAGVPASRYTGTIEVKPKGAGCVADWRVEFLASNQPDIVVRTMVSALIETGLGNLQLRFAAAA